MCLVVNTLSQFLKNIRRLMNLNLLSRKKNIYINSVLHQLRRDKVARQLMMSKIFLVFVAIFITVNARVKFNKDHPYNQHYVDHMNKFNIDHENLDASEVAKREKTFLKHMKYYDEHNQQYPYHKVGPTPLSDREPEEISAEMCRTERQPTLRSLPATPAAIPYLSTAAPPATLDYRRYVSQILNQGSCGSCWAFSTMSMLGRSIKNLKEV